MSCMRVAIGMVMALCGGGNGALAAGRFDGCVRAALILPVLGMDGGPVVPIAINGVAAAVVTPRASALFVHDTPALHLPPGRSRAFVSVTGWNKAYETTIAHLAIGPSAVSNVRAYVDTAGPPARIGGRPVLMVLGYPLLSHYAVLIDMPHKAIGLFTYGGFTYGGAHCPGIGDMFAGPHFTVPLHTASQVHQEIGVTAEIDGTAVEMELNPASNGSIISERDARRIGVSSSALENDPQVRTAAGPVLTGRRHRFGVFSIGGKAYRDVYLDVEHGATYNPLGFDFFLANTSIIDFPGHSLHFAPNSGVQPFAAEDGPWYVSTSSTRDAHADIDAHRHEGARGSP
ncbi:retropepsin-like aspartic protease [Nguyenibacter vanlangensis]|uniref:Retropepsin-like aspartic protease n=1 Tax=Nguyenibacter vanlangensis TaxID=1216886 RepID=A0ABZ3D101_9PROT